MGTNIFFNACSQPVEPDPNFREMPEEMFEYFDKTNKVLNMKRIFVEERDKCQEDVDLPELIENLRVTKSYGDALNQFLQPGDEPPREIKDDTVPIEGDLVTQSNDKSNESNDIELAVQPDTDEQQLENNINEKDLPHGSES